MKENQKRIESKTNLRTIFDINNKEYDKHKMRVENIIRKGKDSDHEERLATVMANRIVTVDKAYGRYLVSEELNRPNLEKIFLARFKDLTYTVHDYRIEKIQSFLDDCEQEEDD